MSLQPSMALRVPVRGERKPYVAMTDRLSGVPALYAYFRGAEYPMGRIRALWEAVKMARKWRA